MLTTASTKPGWVAIKTQAHCGWSSGPISDYRKKYHVTLLRFGCMVISRLVATCHTLH